LLLAGPAPAAPGDEERVVRIDVPSHDAVYRLAREFDIAVIDAGPASVKAYAADPAIARLRAEGFCVTVLDEKLQSRTADELLDYRSFDQVCGALAQLAADYPGITRLETLGFSAGGRPIPAMKVTDAPGVDENEACVRLIGAHHGNEKISTEVTLAFLEFLCQNYTTSPVVRDLVDSREFWVVPVLNPDGHVRDRRTNNNGIDLNRDYGYEWEEYSEPFTQPETRAVYAHSDRCIPTLEYEYHSTASYVNYLWDNHPADPPDSAWVIALSRRYADSTYGSSTTELDPINGYDWYEVHGSCEDFVFGVFGCLSWTIETDQPSGQARVDSICVANRRALLAMALAAGWGIRGRVCDSLTGDPLFARIEFTAPRRWHTFTDLPAGDFHRMLEPGTYAVRVTANGYEPRTFAGVVVPDTGAVFLDVPLARPSAEPFLHAQKVAAVRRVDYSHRWSDWVLEALGSPDGNYYTLGSQQSRVEFDVDPLEPVFDRPGDDLTVAATGSYSVGATNDWLGTWLTLGTATGTASFDLAAAGLDSARYLRVVNSSGATLDGIDYLGRPSSGAGSVSLPRFMPRLTVSPVPARRTTLFRFALPATGRPARVAVLDNAGRRVRTLAAGFEGSGEMTWDLSDEAGRAVPDGVYFCRLEAGARSVTRKLVVRR